MVVLHIDETVGGVGLPKHTRTPQKYLIPVVSTHIFAFKP